MAEATAGDKAVASDSMDKLLAYLAAKGQNTPPRPDQITAPPDQKLIVYFDTSGEVQFKDNPAYREDAPKNTVYGSGDSGYFRLDNAGNRVPIQEPNADHTISAAIDRQVKEADRNARIRNEQATGLYVDDKTLADIRSKEATDKLGAETLKQRAKEFAATQKAADARDSVNKSKIEQDILQSRATVGQIEAQTGQVKQATEIAGQKVGPEIGEIEARTAQAREAIETSKQKRNQPQILTQGVEGPSIYKQGPGGEVTEEMRKGYTPKTLTDIAARVGQLDAAMQAKAQELNSKISSTYTAEQADADYQKWMDQTIGPEQRIIDAARDEAMFARSKEQAAQMASSYNAATQAGSRAIEAYQAQAPRRVGDRAAEVMNQVSRTGSLKGVDWTNAAFYEAPDLNKLQENAVSETLKQLYPQGLPWAQGAQAAAASGATPAQALDMTKWRPSALGGPAAAAGGPAPAAGEQPAAGGLTPEQQINRAAAGFQQEAATNQGGGFGGVGGYGGGIGNQGMAGLMAKQAADAEAAAAAAAQQAPAQAAARGAARPAVRGAPRPATPAAPGLGYDPSNIPQVSPPGMGYDPSNIPLQAMSPAVEPTAPGFGYDPSALTTRTAPVANPFPGVQGMNVNGLNVQGLNLGGTVNGVPWADTGVNSYAPPQPNPFAPPPPPTPAPPPQPGGGIQGLNVNGLYLNGQPYDPYGKYLFPQ